MLQQVSHPSMPIKATTPTSPYTSNETLPPHKPKTTQSTSTNYTNKSTPTSPMCKSNTPPPPINIRPHYQTSRDSDKVFIRSDNIHTTQPSKKLAEKFLGPFEILAQVGSISFTLHLPNSMHGIHPVFHISMLEPSTPNEFPN